MSTPANANSFHVSTAYGADKHGPTVRVLIVSAVRLHRESLAAVLSEGNSVSVATAETPNAETHVMSNCDVILFDAATAHGSQEVRELVRECSDQPVLAYGVSEVGSEVLDLAEAGVAGYVAANATTRQLIHAIRQVTRGERPCPAITVSTLLEALGERLNDGISNGNANGSQEHLTRREVEVLALVDRGFSNKEIGQHLYIEAATVRNHVHSILQKLKLRSRAQAANWLRTHNAQASWQRGTFHDDPEPSSA